MVAYSRLAWLVLMQSLACMAAGAHSVAPFTQAARIKESEHSCEDSDEELQHCPLRTVPASFLQTHLRINERASTTEKLSSQQASVAANASNWQNFMSPKDCVSGKSEKDSQACHLVSIETLASAYFSMFSPASVSPEDFEDVFNVISRSGLKEGDCCVVQVINSSVWEVGTCSSQHKVFSTLLAHALSLPDVGFIPDVEMHMCDFDHSALVLPANGVRAPVLVPASLPEGRGYMIPVPMNHRRGKFSQFIKPMETPDTSGYFDICLGRANFDSTGLGRTLAGERQCPPYTAPSWRNKKNVAFFRGSIYGSDAQHCEQCSCQTNSSLCYDCGSACKKGEYGLPCARPRARTQCLRHDLIEGLASRDGFDVTNPGTDLVDECTWEANKYLLVIGNNIGWADRVQDSLFKTSATILVDSGAYEWFYPLMMEDLHFIWSDPAVESVTNTVRTAVERDDQDITQRANAFAKLVFGIDNVARYTALVAKAYGRLQAYAPQIRAGAIQPCDGYATMEKKA